MSLSLRDVVADEADIRLDRWLRRHFPGLTQGVLEKLCRTGQIRVDGKRVEAATRLQPGQSVRDSPVTGPACAAADAKPIDAGEARDLQQLVLYRDDLVMALNKPHGLPVQGGPGIARHLDGMLDALRFGAPDRPRLVHRLDRDTSGLLLLARTPGAAAKLAAAFRGRDVEKTYWAVVVGCPDPPAGRVDRPLARIGGAARRAHRHGGGGRPKSAHAVTDYATLDTVGKKFALVSLAPHTGRTHQLRVHMASLGTPILGDRKYGVEKSRVDGYGEALHLHARALRFPHPAGGTLSLQAALPPHMRETFAALGFDAPAAARPHRA